MFGIPAPLANNLTQRDDNVTDYYEEYLNIRIFEVFGFLNSFQILE